MRIYWDKLANTIEKDDTQIYLVTGSPDVLKQSACRQIRQTLEAKYGKAVTLFVDGQSKAQDIDIHFQGSLFNPNTFIHLKCTEDKAFNTLYQVEAILRLHPETRVIIEAISSQSKAYNSKICKHIQKHETWLSLYPLQGYALKQWTAQHAQALDVEVSAKALQWIIDVAQQDMQNIHQMLLHASVYAKQAFKPSDLSDTSLSQFDVHLQDMIQSLLSAQYQNAIRQCRYLQSQGSAPSLVLWYLVDMLKKCIRLKDHKLSPQSMGIWPTQVKLYQQTLRRFESSNPFKSCLVMAAKIDRMIKGRASGQIWDAFEQLMMRLAKSA